MNPTLEFIEFIERQPEESVHDLADRVLAKCRDLTGAEAGAILVVRQRPGRQRRLEAVSLQNDSLPLDINGFTLPADRRSVAGHVARSGKPVLVRDAYKIPSARAYRFSPALDRLTGYRSRSMLTLPLFDYQDEVVGVIQLVNRRIDGRIAPFDRGQLELIAPANHIVGSAIERAALIEHIQSQNTRLRQQNRLLREQRGRITALQDETEEGFTTSVLLLAKAAELHDEDTGNHILRVNEYAYSLAGELGMPEPFCDEIRYSAALHDVGKMSIDAAILKKRGRLSPAERAEMARHAEYGHEILRHSERLKMASEIAFCHHEKWDGSGYPRGLLGEAIPISARIVALVDVYDALRSPRPYKPGLTHAAARDIILDGDRRIDAEGHFDPQLRDVFGNIHGEFERIYRRLVDRRKAERRRTSRGRSDRRRESSGVKR
jgi:HD-GYP domain-containing protein (c-di-GMP phosphodiesterase class II)